MEDSDNSLPSLLCEEDESCLKEQYHYKDKNFDFCSDFEYIEKLFEKETIFESNSKSFSVKSERSWLKCARLEAVRWVLKTRALFGFHFSTAYLSMIYFDRFFARRSIDNGKSWPIRLLSVACLSLAAKMEECDVPALSEYHVDEYNFEGNVIQKMELLVLSTLEWKISCATPFAYLNYFINKFCGERRSKELINRAVELIFALIEEINVMEHRPSIIAAAAVLAAYDYGLTKKVLEIKVNAIPSWGSLEKEHTFSCYSLLQEIGMLKSKKSKVIVSPSLLPTYSSSIDVLDNSTTTSTGDNKRRRMYMDDDQHCPHLKIPKT
ncbi:G1/S-specific cyclin D [Handroanthus impetiginosus]|uniref:G1/S-specific cyclin D n=1 Tax=Handroanthus impetiginosus TaxID=429701 RepID=A0A2G9GLF9_9LAMI|nr:G1/S-specific cyclin D [Handroanthus impetiginosus]